MAKFFTALLCVVLVLVIGLSVFFRYVPAGRAMWLNYTHTIQKVEDRFSYETRKQVEDDCRAMIANYEADKLTWETYKDNTSAERQDYALAAKARANRTASMYNEFILKNSYVFEGNIPLDIVSELPIIP